MNLLRSGLAVLLFGLLACTGQRADKAPPSADDLVILRDYELRTGDADPQATWSPSGRWILARSQRSLLVMREGALRRHRLTAGRRAGWATWINNNNVIMGPDEWFIETPDGHIVPPSEGLVVFTFDITEGLIDEREFGEGGWRPRPWGDDIIVQLRNMIFRYDHRGEGELYDEGFFPVPQRHGESIAIQTTPMIRSDLWTGKKGLGDLLIRWSAGENQLVRGLVEAHWMPDGGLLATRLAALPEDVEHWWRVGTDLVEVAGPGAEPRVIHPGGRDGDPHPFLPLVALVGADERVRVVDRAGAGERILCAGRRPRWSPDGRQLMVETRKEGEGLATLRIFVFKMPER